MCTDGGKAPLWPGLCASHILVLPITLSRDEQGAGYRAIFYSDNQRHAFLALLAEYPIRALFRLCLS
jgi:hypothetical protein